MKIFAFFLFTALVLSFPCISQELPDTPVYALSSETGKPGETVLAVYFAPVPPESFSLHLINNKEQVVAESRGFLYEFTGSYAAAVGYIGLPSTLKPGNYSIQMEAATMEGSVQERRLFTVTERKFISEEIPLNMEMSDLRTSDDPRRYEEAQQLLELLYTFNPGSAFHTGRFALPVAECPESSHYGDRREFIYIDNETSNAIHNGIDFAAVTGTEVHACGRGKTVLVQDRFITGNTVVLEHFPGIYSLYFHLNSIDVEPGSIVEEGEVIGKVGKTGLATGSHLHWEVRVSGVPVDPYFFIDSGVLDKDEILDMISEESIQEGG